VNPAAWYKYLRSGKTLGEAWRMAARAFAGLLPERLRQKAPRQADFFRSMDACVASQRRLLFVYGDEDKIACAEFSERYPQIAGARVPSCEYVVVPNGDHTFTRSVASDAAIERTRDWLVRHYPG
jgi:pimeloyl-ACP methyl ester carboxylesterase